MQNTIHAGAEEQCRERYAFVRRLRHRLPLRFHMTLILAATCTGGLLTSKGLLALGVTSIVFRYPVAVVVAYLLFFVCVRLWLRFITPATPVRAKDTSGTDFIDTAVDLLTPSRGSLSSGSLPRFEGGGGQFGGGGASVRFGPSAPPSLDSPAGLLLPELGDSGGTVLDGGVDTAGDVIGDTVGSTVSGIFGDSDDLEGTLVLIILGIIVAVVLGAGVYLIYEAPLILSEAAFEALLAAGLVKRYRQMAAGDWTGSVLKATWIPFAITFVVAFAGAWAIDRLFPGVTRIAEIFS